MVADGKRGGDRGGRRPKVLQNASTKSFVLTSEHTFVIKEWARVYACTDSQALRRILEYISVVQPIAILSKFGEKP